MIKNIIFDNGGVIVKYSPEIYLDYFNFEKDKQKELDKLFVSEEWIRFSKGEITSLEFKEYAIKRFPEYTKEVLQILDVDNLRFMIPPYRISIEFIKELKQKGYKTYLLSDINEDTTTYLNKEIEGFEDLFDGIMYSCRVGMVKKDGNIFNEILNKFSINPEETLFLDDSAINLKQAKKYKIHTYKVLEPSKDIKKIKKKFKIDKQEKN